MKIHGFSPYQKDLFRKECDFTEREKAIFELKVSEYLDYQIAQELNISESTVAIDLRRIRSKIFDVLASHVVPLNNNTSNGGCGRCIVAHTMAEWTRIPDYLSGKGTLYIFLDYRTDDKMAYWDNKPDTESNDFGKVVEIDDYFVFPTDGYIMLEFESADEFAKVNIYGANGQSFFEFEKQPRIDIHSKEVFVKCGMKCQYVSKSSGAKIKFIPLV